jgi:hypothetical protein
VLVEISCCSAPKFVASVSSNGKFCGPINILVAKALRYTPRLP